MKNESEARYPEMLPFARQLRALREEKHWTQADFGEQLGGTDTPIQPATISSWEQADKRPSIDTVMRIADLFGVTVDFLLGRSPLPAINEFEALDALKGLFR